MFEMVLNTPLFMDVASSITNAVSTHQKWETFNFTFNLILTVLCLKFIKCFFRSYHFIFQSQQ